MQKLILPFRRSVPCGGVPTRRVKNRASLQLFFRRRYPENSPSAADFPLSSAPPFPSSRNKHVACRKRQQIVSIEEDRFVEKSSRNSRNHRAHKVQKMIRYSLSLSGLQASGNCVSSNPSFSLSSSDAMLLGREIRDRRQERLSDQAAVFVELSLPAVLLNLQGHPAFHSCSYPHSAQNSNLLLRQVSMCSHRAT